MIKRVTMTDRKLQELWSKVRLGKYIDSTDEAGLYRAYLNPSTSVFESDYGIMRIEADGRFHAFAWSPDVFRKSDEVAAVLDSYEELYTIVPSGNRGLRKILGRLGFTYHLTVGFKDIFVRSSRDEKE